MSTLINRLYNINNINIKSGFIACCALVLSSCASHRMVAAPDFAIVDFKTLSFINQASARAEPLYGVDVELIKLLSADGYKVIGDKQLAMLSADEQKKVLLAQVTLNLNTRRSVASVTFVEYATGKPVFSVTDVVKGNLSDASDLSEVSQGLYKAIKEQIKTDTQVQGVKEQQRLLKEAAEAPARQAEAAKAAAQKLADEQAKAEEDRLAAERAEAERLAIEQSLAEQAAAAQKLSAEIAAAEYAKALELENQRIAEEKAKDAAKKKRAIKKKAPVKAKTN